VSDLRTGLSRVREVPEEIGLREELRRKMHALASGAKLMKFDAMDRAIAEALGIIDRTAIDVPIEMVDLDAIDQILEDLPALAWGDSRVSRIEPVAQPAKPTYSALVVGPALMAEALLDEAPGARSAEGAEPGGREDGDETEHGGNVTFACESTPDAQAAFDLARTTEPDLVVLDADLDAAAELVEALMDDPLTEASPIVVVGSFLEPGESARYVAMGVARTLSKPTSKGSLRHACETALEAGAASLPRVAVIGTPSSAPPANDTAHGDRARVRLRGPAAEVRLQGRRVLIADDDPAVVWFLADLLKSLGCIVYEAFDGKQAVEMAYCTSPDLVICDIMMPQIDGFTLCRLLSRDVALHDVPVILLSWKEDLLQRVRELGAGAAGYVRKESDTRAIVARIREALRPRSRVEMRLRDDEGDVRGRMDGISVRTLLEIVCATRPSARVSVRDASFNYEVEIRDGAPQRATRTAGDGTFLEGSRVLAAMLGVGAGRFTVTTSTTTIEAHLDGNLAAQLAKPIARARAATALLTGAGHTNATQVLLAEDLLEDYFAVMPAHARDVAQRIADGASPRTLVLEGVCEASLVQDIICDLSARGVIAGIEDNEGNDLLTPEVARMAQHTDTRASFAPRSATPSPRPAGANPLGRYECAPDDSVSMCDSPDPASVRRATGPGSLEDAVMAELAFRSPEPAQLGLPSGRLAPKPHVPETPEPICEYEGTPPHDQILAMAEPTIVDGTRYGDDDEVDAKDSLAQIPVDEASNPLPPSESRAMKTPLTAVTTHEERPAGVPVKRKAWPMVAFVTATGIVTWAVMHFSMASSAPKQVEVAPPPPAQTAPVAASNADNVTYTNVPTAAEVATGQGLLEIAAPGDSVILVDGVERGRGGATLPLWAGTHDVRITGAEGDQIKAVDVRSGRVARVKF
jgi:DNA-binding response OmpR family regulator